MGKKKKEALQIIGILAIVFVVVVAAMVIVPKLSQNEETTSESTYHYDEEIPTAEETTEETTREIISTEKPVEKTKYDKMLELMTETDNVVEINECVVSIKEMYFDEDTMDGCFHILISVTDETVIDESWYELTNGVKFGKYETKIDGKKQEQLRYHLYTEDFGNIKAEIVDNVLHVYAWLKNDAKLESIDAEGYDFARLIDLKQYNKNPDSYTSQIVSLKKGIKYNKTFVIDDEKEIIITPTSVVFKGITKKNIRLLDAIIGDYVSFTIVGNTADLYYRVEETIEYDNEIKAVLSFCLDCYDDIRGITFNEKNYYTIKEETE